MELNESHRNLFKMSELRVWTMGICMLYTSLNAKKKQHGIFNWKTEIPFHCMAKFWGIQVILSLRENESHRNTPRRKSKVEKLFKWIKRNLKTCWCAHSIWMCVCVCQMSWGNAYCLWLCGLTKNCITRENEIHFIRHQSLLVWARQGGNNVDGGSAQRYIYIQNHFIHFGTMKSHNNVTWKCWWEHVSDVSQIHVSTTLYAN